MARIIAIDLGRKKTGLAVTDPQQIIVSGLDTIPSQNLIPFLKTYFEQEGFEKIVLGHPALLDPDASYMSRDVEDMQRALSKRFPDVEIVLHDESFSSSMAKKIVWTSGASKKQRRRKELVDKISAVLILQDYLGHI